LKRIDISIPSRPNIFVMVDDEDFEWLSQWKWHPHQGSSQIYARRCQQTNWVSRKVTMHAEILKPGPGLVVDHIDGNALNNQRSNLRVCTNAENQRNRHKQRTRDGRKTTSSFKGVSWHKASSVKRPFVAQITVGNRTLHLGSFASELEAAIAYDVAATKHFGEFAKTNYALGLFK
jgi:hypothetical protein